MSLQRRIVVAVATLMTASMGVMATAGEVSATVSLDGNLVPITPARLLDTRSGDDIFTSDGDYLGGGMFEMRGVEAVQVAGREGIADDAEAVMLNVTVTQPEAAGHITVYPCESANDPYPLASNLNYLPGATVPNAVFTKLGDTGMVCFHSWVPAHLVVDATAYVGPGGAPKSIEPARYLETRDQPGEETFDGAAMQRQRVMPGDIVEFQVAGRGGDDGVPSEASEVLLNVTAVLPSGIGHLTVFPCGIDLPATSSLNFQPGVTRANQVLTAIGDDGKVCISTVTETDIIADVNGYLTAGGGREAVSPVRCVDTRIGDEFRTVDGLFEGDGKIAADDTYEVTIGGRCNVPDGSAAAYLNVTAVNAEDLGHLTIYPCDETKPLTSNVNYSPGEAVPNGVVAKISLAVDGRICIYSHARTDVIVDVTGYVPPPSPEFSQVSYGGAAGCGLEPEGTLICWGDNLDGQVVPGGTDQRGFLPTRIAGLSDVAEVSLGSNVACAVMNDATARCWGNGTNGELGDGDAHADLPAPIAPVVGLSDVASIDVGADHVCAVTNAGEAYCWGRGNSGRLGNGSDANVSTATKVTVIPAGRSVVDIAAGPASTCAVLDDGTGLCWGFAADGIYGYLGDGEGDNGGAVQTSDGTILVDIVDIDGGFSHYCARTEDGEVYCWGNNTYGQIGDGTTEHRSAATRVDLPFAATAVSAGHNLACAAVGDGASYCWGQHQFDGDTDTATHPTPIAVANGDRVLAIAGGSGDTTCWLRFDGHAECAGSTFDNQTGSPIGGDEPSLVYTWLAE